MPRGMAAWVRRGALGIWFCVLGAVGFLRSWMKTRNDGAFAADAVGWMWFGGSVALVLVGIALLARRR